MAPSPHTTSTSNGRDVERARAEVEQARERLAETVEELSAAVDPRPRIEEAKEKVSAAGSRARRVAPPVLAAIALTATAVWVVRRRREREAGAPRRILRAGAAKAGVEALRRRG